MSNDVRFTKHARAYNLTVDDLHTYYVLAGETPVLVHNSNCGIRKHGKARGAAGVDEMTETFENSTTSLISTARATGMSLICGPLTVGAKWISRSGTQTETFTFTR